MPKKKLSVGVPATLNLRAELDRARQECKDGTSGSSRKMPKTSSLALGTESQNKGVQDRAQKDIQALDDERLSRSFAHARARQILEEKAKLYDLLSTTGDDAGSLSASQLDDPRIAKILEEGSVDFVTKQLAHLRRRNDSQDASTKTGPDLVEVIDEFGRSRMVPRSDARKYRRNQGITTDSDRDGSDTSSNSDFGDESAEHEPIARRSCGLGYYSLSQGSDKRQDQLQALRLMHKHTTLTREEAAVSVVEKQEQQLEQRRAQLRICYERFAKEA